jgi:hypothetical protein
LSIGCNGLGTPGEELAVKSSTVSKVPPVWSNVEELVSKCCCCESSCMAEAAMAVTGVVMVDEGVQVEYLAVGEVDLLAMLAKSLDRRY